MRSARFGIGAASGPSGAVTRLALSHIKRVRIGKDWRRCEAEDIKQQAFFEEL
jgi:hypothetical protein